MTVLMKGKKVKPISLVLYGTPGVGKSTFASGAPGCVFVGPEENDELEAMRFPITKSYAQFLGYLKELKDKKHQGIKTVVIDSISAIEKMIHVEIVDTDKKNSMALARGSYGKAYEEAAAKLWRIKKDCEILRDKNGYNVIVIGHATKSHYTDPLLEIDYDMFEMGLHKSGRRDCNSFFTEWASTVLFINWATYKSSDEKFAKGVGTREVLTEHRPSHLAKNRFGLPYRISLDGVAPGEGWKILEGYISDFYKSGKSFEHDPEVDNKITEIHNLIKLVDDEATVEKIKKHLRKTVDRTKQMEHLKVTEKRVREIVENQK